MVYICVLENVGKVSVCLLIYIKGIMGVCFYLCILKVVFGLYLSKLTTYLPIYGFSPT